MDDLDNKRPLLPDEYIFPIEPITGSINDYPVVAEKLAFCETPDKLTLTAQDRTRLRRELEQMRLELVNKQNFYWEQFETLKKWMTESFNVPSTQVLIDHQAKIKEAELAAEETMNQGNSKQHQRIRTLSINLANAKEQAAQKEETEDAEASDGDRSEEGTSFNMTGTAPPRASKNLSRMNAPSTKTSSGTSGPQPQGQKDLSALKGKVTNQIPINVFWNYIEPFFKPIDEDDLKFLDDPSNVLDVAPFTIPPLGSHYENIWYEQYGYVVPGSENRRASRVASGQVEPTHIPLRDRLLSALIDKTASIDEEMSNAEFRDDEMITTVSENTPVAMDDRLKASLQELGFEDLKSSRDFREDDEICVEMRAVQRQLREQIVINQYRKRRLAEFIRSKLAGQEFYSLIGDIEKQIESIFQRRIKNAKKKKKTGAAAGTQTEPTAEIPQEALQYLENRKKLLESFSSLVASRIDVMNPPDGVDFDSNVEKQILETAKKSSSWLPLPEIPLKQPLTTSQPAFPIIKRQ